MNCPTCGTAMVLLFTSAACDKCDGLLGDGADTGWIVWRNRGPGRFEYVFRTPEDARRWRRINGFDDHPIRMIRSMYKFEWMKAFGTVRELEFATRQYEIFEDDQYEPAKDRAHLAGLR